MFLWKKEERGAPGALSHGVRPRAGEEDATQGGGKRMMVFPSESTQSEFMSIDLYVCSSQHVH